MSAVVIVHRKDAYTARVTTAPDAAPCRTCGRPRGENIAEGTRCAACGRRQAIVLWLTVAVAALLLARPGDGGAVTLLLVALAATPVAFVLAVLLHELTHAAVALLLGQTVTRVLVGEGATWWRLGRDPQLVVGSVPLGNGLTTVLDLRPAGYRWRMCATLLAAPTASAALTVIAFGAALFLPQPARVAVLLFGWANAAMAIITMIPFPTFGGRVWSDLASALYLLRADAAAIDEHLLLSAQDRMAILVDAGLTDRAIETGRAAVAAAPSAPLAHSLLAYALHRAGRTDEAQAVARAALEREMDEDSRVYLRRFVDVEPQQPLTNPSSPT